MAEASSASATKSDEENIEMLDQLLTRLAPCDDSSLQPLLSKLLPFTISALSSQSSAVRNKVRRIAYEMVKLLADAAGSQCTGNKGKIKNKNKNKRGKTKKGRK